MYNFSSLAMDIYFDVLEFWGIAHNVFWLCASAGVSSRMPISPPMFNISTKPKLVLMPALRKTSVVRLCFLQHLKFKKMDKIIVKNQTELSMISVLELVKSVIKMGRISNNEKQYCYLTSLNIENTEYHVVTDLRQKSDVFTIYKVTKKQK
jgi:hypothetical protein